MNFMQSWVRNTLNMAICCVFNSEISFRTLTTLSLREAEQKWSEINAAPDISHIAESLVECLKK